MNKLIYLLKRINGSNLPLDKSFSKNIIYFIIILFSLILLREQKWKKESRVIESDVVGYYAYLPATFIYKDLTLDFISNYKGPHKFKIFADKTAEGNKFIRYTMGMSILYLPFFLLGHVFAHLLGFDTGGYTEPYKFFLQFSCLVYLLIGLLFLRKVLLRWFSDKITGYTILLIVLGTNLFYYSAYENTMPHSYNFSLICVGIYSILKWYDETNIKSSVKLGLISGLIGLVRPIDLLLIVTFFIFYDVTHVKAIGRRLSYLISSSGYLLIIILSSIIVWMPQFIYWQKICGSWLFYTYGVSGGDFYFDKPQIINGLFSYRKGWFVYTPIMMFAIFGLITLLKNARDTFIAITFFTLIFIYISFSWWSWWYGGGFSIRSLVDTYGLLAIPLASFLKWNAQQKKWIKRPVIAVLIILFCLSILNNIQYKRGVIHYDSMTKEAYWAVFGELKIRNEDRDLMCKPDYVLARKGIYECTPYTELENHGW